MKADYPFERNNKNMLQVMDREEVEDFINNKVKNLQVKADENFTYLQLIIFLFEQIYNLDELRLFYKDIFISETKIKNNIDDFLEYFHGSVIIDSLLKLNEGIVNKGVTNDIKEISEFMYFTKNALKLFFENNISLIAGCENNLTIFNDDSKINEDKNEDIVLISNQLTGEISNLNDLDGEIKKIWKLYNVNERGDNISVHKAPKFYYIYLFYILIIKYNTVFIQCDDKMRLRMTEISKNIRPKIINENHKSTNLVIYLGIDAFIRNELLVLPGRIQKSPLLLEMFDCEMKVDLIGKYIYHLDESIMNRYFKCLHLHQNENLKIHEIFVVNNVYQKCISEALNDINIKKHMFVMLSKNDEMEKLYNRILSDSENTSCVEDINIYMEELCKFIIDTYTKNKILQEKLIVSISKEEILETLNSFILSEKIDFKKQQKLKAGPKIKKCFTRCIYKVIRDKKIRDNLYKELVEGTNLDKEGYNELLVSELFLSVTDSILCDNESINLLYEAFIERVCQTSIWDLTNDDIDCETDNKLFENKFYETYRDVCYSPVNIWSEPSHEMTVLSSFSLSFYRIINIAYSKWCKDKFIPIRCTSRNQSYLMKYNRKQMIYFDENILNESLKQFFIEYETMYLKSVIQKS